MKNSKLYICDATIHPGESTTLALPLPELYTCTSMYMPIKVLHGNQKGPCMLVFAATSGKELNGVEIINRLLNSIKAQDIKGTLIAVPVLNVYAMINYPLIPTASSNISTCFPGNENGSFGERIAHVFTNQILNKADYCIELLTGDTNYNALPQVYCNFDNIQAKNLAKIFGAPVITNVTTRKNTIRQTTEHLNIPFIAYEAGEAMRFNQSAIELGIYGLKNILAKINMLDDDVTLPPNFKPMFSHDEEWMRASKGGVLHSQVNLGQQIQEDEKIATISDPFSADISETVKANRSGIVVGINENPLIFEGQSIFKIDSFIDNEKAESALESWEQHN